MGKTLAERSSKGVNATMLSTGLWQLEADGVSDVGKINVTCGYINTYV